MKSLESGELLYQLKDGVANLTINRPQKLNALNSQLVLDLYELACQLDDDPQVRVVVIRGAGDRAFIAGADIGEFAQMQDSFEFRSYYDSNAKLFTKLMQLSQPVIAAVDGFAFGGGCGLSLAADMVIATRRSKFGAQEINMGFPGNGTALVMLTGRQKASELCMLGEIIDAQEAYRLLLVNRLVPDDGLETAVEELCGKLLRKSPQALKMCKKVIFNGLEAGFTSAGTYETDAATVCFDTPACRAAIDGFVNKGKQ